MNTEQGTGNEERSASIDIGGVPYKLTLTTLATKEIAARYGGLEKLGNTLMRSENFEAALDQVIWLIVLLVNQDIRIHNLRNPSDPKKLVTVEEVELLTSPGELATYQSAIVEAMFRGTKRNVDSETDIKNPAAGEQIHPA